MKWEYRYGTRRARFDIHFEGSAMSDACEEGSRQLTPLDFAGFAQEFLRRSPAYREDYYKIGGGHSATSAERQAEMARKWGLCHPISPEASASLEPALWAPEASAYTIILEPVAPDFVQAVTIPVDARSQLLVDQPLARGRYLVLDDADGPHRLWLRDKRAKGPFAYVILPDAAADMRFAMAQRLDHRLRGVPTRRVIPGHQPTPFQRRRLSLLLGIIDATQQSAAVPACSYDIARQLVYPAMRIGRGAEWKSSSERRHTQRLIDEARRMMDGGYRRLLLGKAVGATKMHR